MEQKKLFIPGLYESPELSVAQVSPEKGFAQSGDGYTTGTDGLDIVEEQW